MIRIQDDLYNAVNGEWIEKAEIPADLPVTGGFIDLVLDVEKIMLDEFKTLSKEKSNNELLNRAINLYNKVIDEPGRLKGLDYLLNKIKYLSEVKSYQDFTDKLEYLYENGYPLPFSIGVSNDMKDSTKYSLVLSSISTILPDTTMYNTPNEAALIGIYSQMVMSVFTKLGLENKEDLLNKTIEFDKKISKIVKSSEEWADYISAYNPYEVSKVSKLLGFDLSLFLNKRFGKCPKEIIVFDPKFLDNYEDLLKDSFELYKAWAITKLVLAKVPYLSEEYRALASTYSMALSGSKEITNINRYAYAVTNQYYDEVVGIYYGQKYFGDKAKKDVIELVHNLIDTYKNRLAKNNWLSKETIKKAILKLDTMEIKIGYPDKVSDKYYKLIFDDNKSLIEVIDELNKINSREEDDKLYKAVDRTLWVMSGNTVNACYNPSFNDITFPAAILQKPFYDYNQTIEENYGGIGCVIGHEISHAFDNNGAKMDELGNINNWWTEEDFKNFEVKTEAMINQFDGLELEGEKVNGRLSVSENIADNGGVASSLESLKKVKENPDLTLFFINYAKIWRQKARPEYTKLLLTVDVHGPCYYRTNMQVRNFSEFYETFKVEQNDKMYLEPDKRVIIW